MEIGVKWIFRTCVLVGILAAILFAPLFYARLKYPASAIEDLVPADVALVFGALVRDGKISPLHEERLTAAIDLLNTGIIPGIVVSNTQVAAETMARYLKDHGVRDSAIEVDGQAVQTPDTCSFEVARNTPRTVIFISQGFHIPRLSLQCDWEGLKGQSLPAENFRASNAGDQPIWQVVRIRSSRHLREAFLTWVAVLGFYDDLATSEDV